MSASSEARPTLTATRSADGTSIAIETLGTGPTVVLVGGAWNDRTSVAGVAAVLASDFTTVTYDRRGRGASSDASRQYVIEREVEDLAAVLDHVGGSALMFGHSSGAILGLEGSLQGLPITKLALYDPPFIPKDSRPRPGDDFADRLIDLIEADRLGEAVRLYQTEVIGFPPEAVDFFEASDAWSWLTGLAHTLPYDYALLRPDLGVPTERLSGVRVPTLVVVGGNSFDWLQTAAQLVAEAIPAARYVTLEGEDHAVLERPEVLRSILVPFLAP